MRTKSEIKTELASFVARKMELTRGRLALKCIPFKERTAEQHREMLHLGSEASVQKEMIRHLQLAYAFVRGLPYWRQERRAKDTPYAPTIASYAGVEKDAIVAWLAAEPDASELAAHDANEAEARRKGIEARNARGRAAVRAGIERMRQAAP